jgi:hypothetical protein
MRGLVQEKISGSSEKERVVDEASYVQLERVFWLWLSILS